MSQNVASGNVEVAIGTGAVGNFAASPGALAQITPETVNTHNQVTRRHREEMGAADMGVLPGVVNTTMSARFGETKWEAHESQRQRELEEARARAAQMEKTMKWWSDCTANWREKWSKVRNERNKIREENKQLRTNLDLAMKEANSFKREKNDLEIQITQLKKEMEKVHTLMMKHAGQFHKVGIGDACEEDEANGRDITCSPDISSDGLKNNVNNEDGLVTKSSSNETAKDLNNKELVVLKNIPSQNTSDIDDVPTVTEKQITQKLPKDEEFVEEYLMQKITMLQLRLDEAQKTVQVERDEKLTLHKKIEKFALEVQELNERHEELRSVKQEAVRELLTLQEQHRAELRIVNNTLQEEVSARSNLDRRLGELRIELERLQAENASEWGKRERLETEKLALERDNKKLRSEIRDCQERSNRKSRPAQANDSEIRALHQEISEKNKEITELKMSHTKLKKLLAETNTELEHAVRRAEQYEAEVKRLRQRVDELKRDLAGAEDELDSAVNQLRRLQRTNEELAGQNESFQVQIQHLQSSPQQRQQKHHNSILNNVGVNLRNKIDVELSNDCLPNINDLRQIFDYNNTSDNVNNVNENIMRRASYNERSTTAAASAAATSMPQNIATNSALYDQSIKINNSNHLEEKMRNIDFERAKQKFDNPGNNMLIQQHQNYQLQQQQQQQQQQHHQHQQHQHKQRQQQQRNPRERVTLRYSNNNNNNYNGDKQSQRTNFALPQKSTASGGKCGGYAKSEFSSTAAVAASLATNNTADGKYSGMKQIINSLRLDGLTTSSDVMTTTTQHKDS